MKPKPQQQTKQELSKNIPLQEIISVIIDMPIADRGILLANLANGESHNTEEMLLSILLGQDEEMSYEVAILIRQTIEQMEQDINVDELKGIRDKIIAKFDDASLSLDSSFKIDLLIATQQSLKPVAQDREPTDEERLAQQIAEIIKSNHAAIQVPLTGAMKITDEQKRQIIQSLIDSNFSNVLFEESTKITPEKFVEIIIRMDLGGYGFETQAKEKLTALQNLVGYLYFPNYKKKTVVAQPDTQKPAKLNLAQLKRQSSEIMELSDADLMEFLEDLAGFDGCDFSDNQALKDLLKKQQELGLDFLENVFYESDGNEIDIDGLNFPQLQDKCRKVLEIYAAQFSLVIPQPEQDLAAYFGQIKTALKAKVIEDAKKIQGALSKEKEAIEIEKTKKVVDGLDRMAVNFANYNVTKEISDDLGKIGIHLSKFDRDVKGIADFIGYYEDKINVENRRYAREIVHNKNRIQQFRETAITFVGQFGFIDEDGQEFDIFDSLKQGSKFYDEAMLFEGTFISLKDSGVDKLIAADIYMICQNIPNQFQAVVLGFVGEKRKNKVAENKILLDLIDYVGKDNSLGSETDIFVGTVIGPQIVNQPPAKKKDVLNELKLQPVASYKKWSTKTSALQDFYINQMIGSIEAAALVLSEEDSLKGELLAVVDGFKSAKEELTNIKVKATNAASARGSQSAKMTSRSAAAANAQARQKSTELQIKNQKKIDGALLELYKKVTHCFTLVLLGVEQSFEAKLQVYEGSEFQTIGGEAEQKAKRQRLLDNTSFDSYPEIKKFIKKVLKSPDVADIDVNYPQMAFEFLQMKEKEGDGLGDILEDINFDRLDELFVIKQPAQDPAATILGVFLLSKDEILRQIVEDHEVIFLLGSVDISQEDIVSAKETVSQLEYDKKQEIVTLIADKVKEKYKDSNTTAEEKQQLENFVSRLLSEFEEFGITDWGFSPKQEVDQVDELDNFSLTNPKVPAFEQQSPQPLPVAESVLLAHLTTILTRRSDIQSGKNLPKSGLMCHEVAGEANDGRSDICLTFRALERFAALMEGERYISLNDKCRSIATRLFAVIEEVKKKQVSNIKEFNIDLIDKLKPFLAEILEIEANYIALTEQAIKDGKDEATIKKLKESADLITSSRQDVVFRGLFGVDGHFVKLLTIGQVEEAVVPLLKKAQENTQRFYSQQERDRDLQSFLKRCGEVFGCSPEGDRLVDSQRKKLRANGVLLKENPSLEDLQLIQTAVKSLVGRVEQSDLLTGLDKMLEALIDRKQHAPKQGKARQEDLDQEKQDLEQPLPFVKPLALNKQSARQSFRMGGKSSARPGLPRQDSQMGSNRGMDTQRQSGVFNPAKLKKTVSIIPHPAGVVDKVKLGDGKTTARRFVARQDLSANVGGDGQTRESLEEALRKAKQDRDLANSNYETNNSIENLVSLKKAEAEVCEAQINLNRFLVNNDKTPGGVEAAPKLQEDITRLQKQQQALLAEGFNAILGDVDGFLDAQQISAQEALDGNVKKAKAKLEAFKAKPIYKVDKIGITKSTRNKTLEELDDLLNQYGNCKEGLRSALGKFRGGLEAQARVLEEELRLAQERVTNARSKLTQEADQQLEDKCELLVAQALLAQAEINLHDFKKEYPRIEVSHTFTLDIITALQSSRKKDIGAGFLLVANEAEKLGEDVNGDGLEVMREKQALKTLAKSIKEGLARRAGTADSKDSILKAEERLKADINVVLTAKQKIQNPATYETPRGNADQRKKITLPPQVSSESSKLVSDFNRLTVKVNGSNIKFLKIGDWQVSDSVGGGLTEAEMSELSNVVVKILNTTDQKQRKDILLLFGFTESGSNYQYKIPKHSTITHCNVASQFILFEAMSASAGSRSPNMPQYMVPAFPQNEEGWQEKAYIFAKQQYVGTPNIFASIDPLLFQANSEFLKIIDAKKPTILPPRFKTIKLLEETALNVLKAVDLQGSDAKELANQFGEAFTTYQQGQDTTQIKTVVDSLVKGVGVVNCSGYSEVLKPLIKKLTLELNAVQGFDDKLQDVKEAALALKNARTPIGNNEQGLIKLLALVKEKLDQGVGLDRLGECLFDAFSSGNASEKISQEMVTWLQEQTVEGDVNEAFRLVKAKAKAAQEAAFAMPASNKNLQEEQKKAAQKCKETSAEILEKVKALKKLQEALEARNNLLTGGQFRTYEDVGFKKATEELATAYDAVYPDAGLKSFIDNTLKLAVAVGKTPPTELKRALAIEEKLEAIGKGLANPEYLAKLKKLRFKEERDAKLQEFANVKLPVAGDKAENFASVYAVLTGIGYVGLTTQFVDLYQIDAGNLLTDIEDLQDLNFDKIEDLMKVRRYLDKHLAVEEKLGHTNQHDGFIRKIGEFKEKVNERIGLIRNQNVDEFVKYFKQQEIQFSKPAAECSQEEIKARQAIFLQLIQKLGELRICDQTIDCVDGYLQILEWQGLLKEVSALQNPEVPPRFERMEDLVKKFIKLEAALPEGVKNDDFVAALGTFLAKITECKNPPKKDLSAQLDALLKRADVANKAAKDLGQQYGVKPIMDHIEKRFSELSKILENDHPVTIIISDKLADINIVQSLEGDDKTKFKFNEQQSKEVSDLISSKIKALQEKYPRKVSIASLESANEGEPSVELSAKCIYVVAANSKGVDGVEQSEVVMFKIATTPEVSMVIRDDKTIEDMIYHKYVAPSLPSPKPSPRSRTSGLDQNVGEGDKPELRRVKSSSFAASSGVEPLLRREDKQKMHNPYI